MPGGAKPPGLLEGAGSVEAPPGADRPPAGAEPSPDGAPLESLRQILLRDQIARTETLESGLERLERQMRDEGFLARMIAPVLGESIRLKIQEARDEMIEALYPIIGRVVQRAVMEAINDLARSLDAQVKRSFDPGLAWWRVRRRRSGSRPCSPRSTVATTTRAS